MAVTDFLLELRSEEIPARMQDKAREDLARLFTAELDKAGLKAAEIVTYATPRRLALIAKGLPLETEAVSEETKGPKVGAPPQAMEGFLRKVGLTQDQLVERDGIFFAVVEKPGRKTADVLAEAIPAIIRAFPWPKSQRWGAASASTESLRWVRPLQGIVALLGDDVVDCAIDGIVSGSATKGHRFHHSGEVTIGNASDYAMKLRAAHVIVDQEERRAIIRSGAEKAAADAGLVLVPDEGLVNENSGLTEWPVPMLGRFDPAFLEVPEEVIQLTARVNQKYFVCHDKSGKLANAFVCTANIVANDGGAAIVAGNEKVLAARLSDAKFFWEQDRRRTLAQHAEGLNRIVFHEKLGSMLERCDRLGRLMGLMISTSEQDKQTKIDSSISLARIAKADLVTDMVGEFPELQGIMGGYYIAAEGAPISIQKAIREHYQPLGPNDNVPDEGLAYSLALADKIDTIASFFAILQKPTGSKDPFALRRAALGICRIIIEKNVRANFRIVLSLAVNNLVMASTDKIISFFEEECSEILDAKEELTLDPDTFTMHYRGLKVEVPSHLQSPLELAHRFREVEPQDRVVEEIFDFVIDRLKVQQREAGVRHDLIDAVFALGGEDDLVRLLARVKALQGFVGTDEGANLLAGYKRAANILKADPADKNNRHPELVSGSISPNDPSGETDKWMLKQVQHDELGETERGLLLALDSAEPKAAAAIEAEKFEDAMAALASLRAPIDAFFDGVMVNDPDPEKRAFRLGLLARFRDAVHRVADFSRIEG